MIPALAPGPEFDRVREIARVLGERATGLGDDCALVDVGGAFIALSCDVSVEGVHFNREWMTPTEIGWRAAAGALSDLAAMGAHPVGLLASVVLPVQDSSEAVAVMDGVAAAVESVGGKVLGGDLSSGTTRTVDVTVVGRVIDPVRRTGARPGDTLWVTGWLGGARAALQAYRLGETPDSPTRARFAHPEPRIAAGTWLANNGARAMIDLSDGLAGDAAQLAAASGCAAEIDLERLPLVPGVDAMAARLEQDPRTFAALGGEDYELLVALPPSFDAGRTVPFERAVGIPLTRVGNVTLGEGSHFRFQGREVTLRGFSHFE